MRLLHALAISTSLFYSAAGAAQVAPFNNQYGDYVGKTHSHTDYANAGIAYKMRVSFELAE